MKVNGQLEKWGVGVLGVVSLVLIVNLVLQLSRPNRGSARPQAKASLGAKTAAPPAEKTANRQPKVPDELSRYDPTVNLSLLDELNGRPLPDLKRNPFEFVMPPVKAGPQQAAAMAAMQAPPPPPVTLKPMGYSEGKGGVKEVMVSDADQVFVVHAGDSVGTRYKIIKVTPTMITVEDAAVHQTVDLPIPQ